MEITCASSPESLVALVMTLRLLSQWLAWLLVLAIAVFTLSPIELRPVTAAPANWERFTTFMAIGALLCLGYPQHRWRMVGLVIGLAGLLEVLQRTMWKSANPRLSRVAQAVTADSLRTGSSLNEIRLSSDM